MDEKIVELTNVKFSDVLDLIKLSLKKIPNPAYEFQNPENGNLTRYNLDQTIYYHSIDDLAGSITIRFSKAIIAKYGIIAGVEEANNQLVFKCDSREERNEVFLVVRGYCPDIDEETSWVKPVFDALWKELVDAFALKGG